MIDYTSILQTGIQSLLAVACGWGCGKWGVLQPDPTVAQVNTLVLKFCIPCLQVWLLAIKTDMRQPGSWSALLAFLAWSLGLHALLALAQLLRHGRLHYAQLGVDSLLLTTNNTGILGPVVLMAALGPDYAPLGMLATVALYFQQLPSAQLLFQLHKEQTDAAAGAKPAASTLVAAASMVANAHGRQQQLQADRDRHEQESLLAPAEVHAGCCSSSAGLLADTARGSSSPTAEQAAARRWSGGTQASAQPGIAAPLPVPAAAGDSQCGSASRPQPLQRHCSSADSLHQLHHRQPQQDHVLHITQHDVQQQQQHQQHNHLLLKQHNSFGGQKHHSSASLVASLLLKNPLVWSTGVSLLLSCLGSSVLLNPSSPAALQQLSFIDGLLGWFAATTAPLTLFTTGLWMYSNSAQQQHAKRQKCQPLPGQQQQRVAAGAQQEPQQQHHDQQQQLGWQQLWMYLVVRATIAPGFMVFVCWAMGFKGDLAHALVVLALLPVAQTAFVVCKQADIGTHTVSVLMVASLLVMLPQLMVLLALLEWLDVFT